MEQISGLAEALEGPACLHKGGRTWETRVGWGCDRCWGIRHRHSVLMLVPFKEIGGVTLSHDAVVPISALVAR